jgi:putative transposase
LKPNQGRWLNSRHQSFANHYEVVQNVESYIYFYNYKRIHSAIGYLTPAQKMAELEKVA